MLLWKFDWFARDAREAIPLISMPAPKTKGASGSRGPRAFELVWCRSGDSNPDEHTLTAP